MPLYKTGMDMFKKYQKKYNPTVIGTRFADVQDLALERAQEGLLMVGTIRDLVRPILDAYGVTGGQKATYLAFALKLMRHIARSKGEASKKIAEGLKAYFVITYGLDPTILDEIIRIVCGWVVPY